MFDGDFIQRHATAVADFCKVHVIYIKKDDKLAANTLSECTKTSGNKTEQIIYYNTVKTGIRFFDRLLSHLKYKHCQRKYINAYISDKGLPSLVHVHVAMNAGAAALWIKRKWNIPYIVSEHWTGYLDEADVKLSTFSKFYQNQLKQVLNKASHITTVSAVLATAIQQKYIGLQCTVIPNVVDTGIFFPIERKITSRFNFIHVSNMSYQKNIYSILEAFSMIKDKTSYQLNLYGTYNSEVLNYIQKFGLQQNVFIKGEVPQEELANALRQSDALILYSHFETFGCVIIEANACGLPVIVSDLEVFHEIVQDNVNGIFVINNNSNELAKKLKSFISNPPVFQKNELAGLTAQKFAFPIVGQQFINIYDKISTPN